MAAWLTDVDVLIGAIRTRCSVISRPVCVAPYPTIATNRDGGPVCIGQAWEYAKAI